jgi:hypothetical protein
MPKPSLPLTVDSAFTETLAYVFPRWNLGENQFLLERTDGESVGVVLESVGFWELLADNRREQLHLALPPDEH